MTARLCPGTVVAMMTARLIMSWARSQVRGLTSRGCSWCSFDQPTSIPTSASILYWTGLGSLHPGSNNVHVFLKVAKGSYAHRQLYCFGGMRKSAQAIQRRNKTNRSPHSFIGIKRILLPGKSLSKPVAFVAKLSHAERAVMPWGAMTNMYVFYRDWTFPHPLLFVPGVKYYQMQTTSLVGWYVFLAKSHTFGSRSAILCNCAEK